MSVEAIKGNDKKLISNLREIDGYYEQSTIFFKIQLYIKRLNQKFSGSVDSFIMTHDNRGSLLKFHKECLD